MRTVTKLAPALLLALLAGASTAIADDCMKLVEPYGPTNFPRGKHTVTFQAPVSAGAQWFLDVERIGHSTGEVLLNGQTVVRKVDLAGQANEFVRVPVQLAATNTLRVEVVGQTTLRVHVRGVVPAASVPANVGRRTARITLFESPFAGRIPANRRTTQVQLPTTQGLFDLRVQNGLPAAATATLEWNGLRALGALPIRPGQSVATGPIRVNGTNQLETSVLGVPSSSIVVTVDGWIVDEVAPTASWTAPAPNALLVPTSPLILAAQDALSGIASITFSLNGTDVTAAFTRTATGAQATLAALPASALLADNTLTAVVKDRACGETTATVTFRVGLDDVDPPVIAQPADLTVEQQEPAGSVVTYATPAATDDTDPNPTVTCVPASGSLFPPGATTVTCTATDASGKSSQVTFTVIVLDRTGPTLAQPADVTAEQTSAAGAVVTYTAPTATDAVDPAPIVVCTPASGTLFPGGVTTVTCVATDAAGNTSQVTFTVSVLDRTAPTLTQPANVTVEQVSPAGAVVTYTAPTATDAVDPAPDIVCTPASGTVFLAGVTTVTCVATDAAGNAGQVTFTVSVLDRTAPVLAQPADLTVEQTSPAGAVVTYVTPVATDSADPAPVVVCTPASGTVFPAGVTTVTCVATDAAGNTSQVTFAVSVLDRTAPVLAQPDDLLIEQASAAGAIVTYAAPSVTDAADPAPVVVCTPASNTLFPAGATTVTCVATDASGNTSQVTFTVTVLDRTAPMLTQPADLTVEPTSPAGAIVTYVEPTATDAVDPAPVVVCVPASGTVFAPGATTVTCTATDAAGNSSQVTFTVTVLDRTPPVLTQPDDLLVEQTSAAGAIVTYTAPAATDAVDPAPVVVCTPASGTLFPAGVTTVTCVATDASGNASQVTFTVTVLDRTAPALTQPVDMTVEQTSAAGAVVTYATPTATDAVDPAPAVVCTPASGALFPAGATTVTCVATDVAGNSSQVTFVVSVLDRTGPGLTQPANLTVEQTSAAGAVVTYAAPTATDTVDPAPVVVCTPASGSLFAGGVTTVTCVATDAAGNSSQVTFTVSVLDRTAPTLTQPADLTVEQTSPAGTVVAYAAPTATDAVDPAPAVVCTPASGSVFPAGPTAVTCVATDAAGNVSQVTFTITVLDRTPPALEQPADLTVEQTSAAGAIVVYATPNVTDAADPAPDVVCTPASGTLFAAGVTTVTCTATDVAGNTSQVTFTVTVLDRTPPVLAQPPNVTVEQTSPAGAIVFYAAPTATDAVDPAPVVVCTPSSGSLFPPGATIVVCVATDAAGNSSQVTFMVTVGDDQTPPVLTQPEDLTVEQTSPAGAVVTYTAPTATDDVDPAPVVTCAPASGTLFPPGDTAVICTATDASGNSSQVTFTVTVVDTVAPELALEPLEGALLTSTDVLLRAQWTDTGSGVATQTFVALVDGQDRTASFDRSATEATATLSLSAGAEHTFEATVSDVAGNSRTVLVRFRVEVAALVIDHLELRVGPAVAHAAPDEEPLLTLAPEARSIDGSGNDLANPDEGKTHSRLQRRVGAAYADGVSTPAGPTRPSPRVVSNGVHAQAASVLNARRASDVLWIWGQFLDHDLSLTRAADPAEPLPIPVPPGDLFDPYGTTTLPFNRSSYDPNSSPREQVNELSAWIDASMVYGADPVRAAALRTNDGTGRLRTSAGDLLPRNTDALDNLPTRHDPSFFLAGDVRANQNVPLLALHTLFVREHNRLADLLRTRFPQATDEELYQGARRIVSAEIQAITYQEFLPVLLGPNTLSPYAGYQPSVDVGIENAFAHSAFRVGHSLLSPQLLRLDAQGAPSAAGPLALQDALFAPARLTEDGGLESLLRGAAYQLAQELDPLVVDGVRNYLFAQPGQGGLDLPALDLQRGRDHGLPSYNEARRQLGLAAKASFAEVTSDPTIRARLASVYADVEAIDLWTGGLCEDDVPGALVGELIFTLLKQQFEVLRDGDRFFYESHFSGPALEALASTRLADVIRRNTTIGAELSDDVFTGPLLPFTENDFTVRAVAANGETVTDFTGFVSVTTSDGKAPLDGFLFELTAAEQGRVTFPGLAFFQTLGTIVITARTVPLVEGDLDVTGSVEVDVVLAAPVVFPTLPETVALGDELTIQGLSFQGQQVELLVDGQLFATEVAGPGGGFTISVRLPPGTHQIVVRAIDPATGQVVSTTTYTVEQQAPPAQALEASPASVSIAVGQSKALAITQRLSDQTTRDVTTLATYVSSAPLVASVSAAGVVTAHATGSASITASLDGLTVVVPVTVGVPVLVETSPLHTESGVAVTRETVLRFSAPVAQATITPSAIFAQFGGQTLAGMLHVSRDRRTVTLFYAEALPTSARVRVTVDGDLLRDDLGNPIDVDRDGVPGGVARIDFDTLTITVVPGTVAYGRVFSSQLANEGQEYPTGYTPGGTPAEPGDVISVSAPLSGARISVVGAEDTLFTFTDEYGSFRLDPSPAGTFFVHVEVIDPTRSLNYPDIGKPWTTIVGEETSVGDIYLPIIGDEVMQPVSDTEESLVGFTDEIAQAFPHLVGTQITVPAGSLYSVDGSTEEKTVGISPVPPDRLPAPLPDGLDFSVVFTIQTQGGENFDVPAPVRFPNTEGLPPGAKSALWSFNHDTGQWEVIGSMTVSADGLWVETDPGVGILAPGWHGWASSVIANGAASVTKAVASAARPNADVPPEPTIEGCKCAAQCIDGKLVKDATEPQGQSVLLHSGEEKLSRVDVAIPGRGGLDFVLSRTYRSRLDYDGPIGQSWDFNYNERLFVETNGDVTRNNGSSHVDPWVRQANGTFLAPRGFFGTLSQRPDGVYVMRETDGFQRLYRPDGLLLAHVDRFGNRLEFEHDEFGDLDWVVDAYGREIDFTFQTFADGKRRLTKVRDFATREWIYTYNELGQLTAVRTPIVVGTSTGNDFPAGRTERYTYSSGAADPRLNHNLLTVTSPEEAANGGPPSLVLTYGTDSNDTLTFDKVIVRDEGGVNASGVAAGGRTTISYSLMNVGVSPGDKTLARKRATIVNRNGNVRTSYVNEDDQHILDRTYTRGLRQGEPEFFETRHYFNADNQVVRTVMPAGNEVVKVYGTNSRAAGSTIVSTRSVAGPRGLDGQGAPAEDLVTTFTYEPLYNRPLTITDARGNSPTYTPPLGTNNPGRYTTRFYYDYQEGTGPVPQAVALGIDLSGVPRGLGDLNGDGRTDQTFGNLVRVEAPSVLLAADSNEAARLSSTIQQVVGETRWNDQGQVVATVDPEGNVTTFTYHSELDPDGDGQPTFSFTRALSLDPTGYLQSVTTDASWDPAVAPRRTSTSPPAALTTGLRYDRVGNITAVRNPRGVETHLEVSALNQVVVTTRGADVSQAIASGQLLTSEAPLRYKARTFYDHNGRVIRAEVENRDSATQGVGAHVEATYTYDLLNNPLSTTREVDATTRLTTTLRYDPNENLVEATAPEGSTVQTLYDERDLVFSVTRGAGTSDASTVRLDYDANGNVVRAIDAEDTDGDGSPESTQFTIDGFDRLVEARDALGNRALTGYDVVGNIVRAQVLGHPPAVPTGAPVLLADVRFSHDELDRVFRTDAALFSSSGFTAARLVLLQDHDADGFVTTRIEYDALSRPTFLLEDDLEVTRSTYDGASRLIETGDALGNRLLREYDQSSNVIQVTSVEVSPEGLVPAETLTTRYVWDQLDRLVRATDNAGQTSRFAYDSRDNLILRSDPLGSLTADPLGLFPGQINAAGNTVGFVHDGLGRMIRQVIDLHVGGAGAGALDTSNPRNPDGQIALGYVFDGNSRLVGIVDDNGNRTSFAYDALNRRISQTSADGESYTFVYDRDDNVRTVTDPNGSVVTRVFDALNRTISCSVARAPGVLGTTSETYQYDGLSRLVRATDDNGSAAQATQVTEFVYDSLSRLLEERQNGRAISSRYTGDGKRTQVTYPGGRTISRTFDPIDRIKQLRDGAQILAQTDWIGPGMRELQRSNGNGTALTFLNDASNVNVGYDAVQRLVRLRVLGAGGGTIVDREYGYNRASQRTVERRHDDFGLTDRYTYDSAYRVTASAYDQDGQAGAVPRELRSAAYVMDGVGNRRQVQKQTSVGPTVEAYTVNAVNEYLSVAGVSRTNDDNGNLTDDGSRLFFYDYKNRLVGVSDRATANPVATYEYLADGRRAKKTVYSETTPGQVQKATAFFYDGAQEVEEQDAGSGATEATYVWSPVYVDELVAYTNSAGTYYTHQDARCDVVAITDAAGNVVERVRYDDFGRAEIHGPGGEVRTVSAVGCAYGFQGRRLDAETGLLFFRARMYDPVTGRFLQRDPVWDAGNVGGQYTFVGNGPVSRLDPSGLQHQLQIEGVLDAAGEAIDLPGVLRSGGLPADVRQKLGGLARSYSHTEVQLGQRMLELMARAREAGAANPFEGVTIRLRSLGIEGLCPSKAMCPSCTGVLRDLAAITGATFHYGGAGLATTHITPSTIATFHRRTRDYTALTRAAMQLANFTPTHSYLELRQMRLAFAQSCPTPPSAKGKGFLIGFLLFFVLTPMDTARGEEPGRAVVNNFVNQVLLSPIPFAPEVDAARRAERGLNLVTNGAYDAFTGSWGPDGVLTRIGKGESTGD